MVQKFVDSQYLQVIFGKVKKLNIYLVRPQLQWNANESLCAMIRNKSLHFFNGKTLEFEKKFSKNCTAFKMSPVNAFATYTKGTKVFFF